MDPNETMHSANVILDPTSIAYTVEIHFDEGFDIPTSQDSSATSMIPQQHDPITTVSDLPLVDQEQPSQTCDTSMHQPVHSDQTGPNLLVTSFSETDQQPNLQQLSHQIVSSDIVTHVSDSIPQMVASSCMDDTGSQIIIVQDPHSAAEVQLVKSLASDHNKTVLLMDGQAQALDQTGHHQNVVDRLTPNPNQTVLLMESHPQDPNQARHDVDVISVDPNDQTVLLMQGRPQSLGQSLDQNLVHQTSQVKFLSGPSTNTNQTMLLIEGNTQDPNRTEHALSSHPDTIMREMEIASAVQALEALTGLSTTFNAWAQQNPQDLGAPMAAEVHKPPQHAIISEPHIDKPGRHKCVKHKVKKHKSRKHKKHSSRDTTKTSQLSTVHIHSEESCQCDVCNKVFASCLKLKNHLISHSTERPYICDVCGRAFKRPRYLQIHTKSHFTDAMFACKYCDKTYFERKRLRSHEKCHINPFFCDVCGKAYGDKRGLIIHYRTHTNEKPFLCRLCGRGFTSKAGMNKHQRSHSGLKPYICKVCNKAYTQPTNLSDHERTHINNRTFACVNCPKVFLARSSLRRHRIKNHPGEKPNVGRLEQLQTRIRVIRKVSQSTPDDKSQYKYTCMMCNKTFEKEKYLKKHNKIHVVGSRFCSYCSKNFRDKRDLLNHERRHTGEKPFKCGTCDKAFVSSSAMLRHEKCHLGLRPYTCRICSKGFTRTTGLRDHELIHLGKNKRFDCKNCDKIFASRSALRSHERLKHPSFRENVDAPVASMEVPVETDNTARYTKLMFTEG